HDVEQHEIGEHAVCLPQCFLGPVCLDHLVAVTLKHDAQNLNSHFFVVDDQDFFCHSDPVGGEIDLLMPVSSLRTRPIYTVQNTRPSSLGVCGTLQNRRNGGAKGCASHPASVAGSTLFCYT